LSAIDGFQDVLRQLAVGEREAGVAAYARRVLGFEADAAQARVLDAGGEAGLGLRVLLCCSRQWGKSTTAAALMTHRAVTREGTLVLCVAPTLRQSAELMRKVGEFLGRTGVRFVGGEVAV
jgi:hypothetical protein